MSEIHGSISYLGNSPAAQSVREIIARVASAQSTVTVTIDTSAPAAPVATLTSGSDSGTLGDNTTNDTTPTLTGVAQKIINPAGSQTDPANFRNLEAGDLVDITIGGVTVHAVVGTNTNGFSYNTATGVWSLNTGNVSGFTALTNGDHNISVSVTAGGITKTDISSNELHVNTNAPTLTLDPISGDNRINGTEKNQGLNLTGTTDAEAGSTVSVVLNGVTFTANVLFDQSALDQRSNELGCQCFFDTRLLRKTTHDHAWR